MCIHIFFFPSSFFYRRRWPNDVLFHPYSFILVFQKNKTRGKYILLKSRCLDNCGSWPFVRYFLIVDNSPIELQAICRSVWIFVYPRRSIIVLYFLYIVLECMSTGKRIRLDNTRLRTHTLQWWTALRWASGKYFSVSPSLSLNVVIGWKSSWSAPSRLKKKESIQGHCLYSWNLKRAWGGNDIAKWRGDTLEQDDGIPGWRWIIHRAEEDGKDMKEGRKKIRERRRKKCLLSKKGRLFKNPQLAFYIWYSGLYKFGRSVRGTAVQSRYIISNRC